MAKPTWKPELPEDKRADGYHFCRCCGWRLTQETFCAACREVAASAPPQSARPTRVVCPPLDAPAVKRKGYTTAQKEWIDSILPVTCAVCGAGDHVSDGCPTREATT